MVKGTLQHGNPQHMQVYLVPIYYKSGDPGIDPFTPSIGLIRNLKGVDRSLNAY